MPFSDRDLQAYLDEVLSPDEMSVIEDALRQDKALAKRLKQVQGRREAGIHSLGDIWRRHRVSCPDRDRLGSYLLGVLDPEETAYIKFHIERIGCRLCSANLFDLEQKQPAETQQERRRRYFQSSAGYLRPHQQDD